MAKSYKVLAQSAPLATTETNLYTVPSSTSAVTSTLTVCNRGGSTASYRIAIRPNSASISDEHYVAYDATLPANDTIALTLGLTLGTNDVITVYASTASISFGLFGSEIA